jgi:phenylpropionate dioxygenase-like ring-hydroxylating dioxygenase large terminal subunit
VRTVRYFGRELVVFRTDDGRPHVVDPYCPHLGAHLGHGGCVVGETIRCPFHGWSYEAATGRCVAIPYASKVPPAARVGTWSVDEVSGMILVWFHEEAAPPTWRVPPVPDEEGEWTAWHETRWTIRACIQDVSENDVDSAHLPQLHQFTDRAPTGTVEMKGTSLELDFTLETNLAILGMEGTARGPLRTTKHGLSIGYIVHHLDVHGISISTRTLGNTTPIDEHHVDVRLLHSIKKTPFEHVNRQMEEEFIKTFRLTVEQDIRIWENKVHLVRPLLCDGDGPIATYRKWCRQFYAPAELERVFGSST